MLCMFLLGTGASATVFHVVLKAGTSNDDGTGGTVGQEKGTVFTGTITVAGTPLATQFLSKEHKYMIETPTTNPTLTFDQLQAIDVAQKTLANLQSEINNATKVLKGTKMECDRAVKNQVYNEELLGNLTAQVETKTKELADLKESITEKTAMLNELLSQFKEHNDKMATAQVAHDERETQIATKELDLASKENKLTKIAFALDSERKELNQKVAKLKEVISTF